jgi:hypothetical protein
VVAHNIETDTAKKISAVQTVHPCRKIHSFLYSSLHQQNV